MAVRYEGGMLGKSFWKKKSGKTKPDIRKLRYIFVQKLETMERNMERERLNEWNEYRPQQVYELALLGGLTHEDMARCMCITLTTFESWLKTHASFAHSLEEGGMRAVARVARALFRSAEGYEYDEEVCVFRKGQMFKEVVHRVMPPNVAACIKILSARHKSEWSEVQRTEITQTTNINLARIDLSSLNTEELTLMKSIGLKMIPNRADSSN